MVNRVCDYGSLISDETGGKKRKASLLADLRIDDYLKRGAANGEAGKIRRVKDYTEETNLRFYSPFFKELTPNSDIIGREEESLRIVEMMMQPLGGIRPLLIGPSGIGKTTIIRKAASYLREQRSHQQWGDVRIFKLDCTAMIAGQIGSEYIEEVGILMQEMTEATYHLCPNAVIYFKDIEKLIHLEQISEYVQTLFMKPSFFIVSISRDIKEDEIAASVKILANYNFQKVFVKESPLEDIHRIVRQMLARQPLHPDIKLDDDAITVGVELAHKYEHERPNPIKSVNLIHSAANRVLMRGADSISKQDIAQYVSSNTGIAAEELLDSAGFDVDKFQERIKRQVVCQDEAVRIVSEKVAAHKMGFVSRSKPWGVFLFIGPTGVGKTELAKTLARQLFHDERFLFKIDGSCYREEHSFATLIGSPSGYVGHESGGILTNALKANPHQVVIFDEFEKAHPAVRNLLLQIADDGKISDTFSGFVDCHDTLFIMTSNIGSDELFEISDKEELDSAQVREILNPLLAEELSPELLGRFTAVVPFQPLKDIHLEEVAKAQLRRLKTRLAAQCAIELFVKQGLIKFFAKSNFDLKLGMRKFCNFIDASIENTLVSLSQSSGCHPRGKVIIGVKEGQVCAEVRRE